MLTDILTLFHQGNLLLRQEEEGRQEAQEQRGHEALHGRTGLDLGQDSAQRQQVTGEEETVTGSQVAVPRHDPLRARPSKSVQTSRGPSVSLYWLCVYSNECMKMGVGSVSV